MKCSKMEPCPSCPFRKESLTKDENSLILKLSKLALTEKEVACGETSNLERCAGSVIHASLSNKTYKSKKLRFYQTKLGKNSEILSKEDLLIWVIKK